MSKDVDEGVPCVTDAAALGEATVLAENARLRREVAEVRHKLGNRTWQYQEELEFWQSSALQMQLHLLEPQLRGLLPQLSTEDEESDPETLPNGSCAASSGTARWSTRRGATKKQAQTEQSKRLAQAREELKAAEAACEAAEHAAAAAEAEEKQLRQRFSEQALRQLTRRSAGPAQTFITSMAKTDAATLRWVKQEIEAHLQERSGAASFRQDSVGSGKP
mmetsp:Transcript_63837/g.118666  ORF Transcript_63837/g.118666 Transcript_63837/m.118666 type:complete len:220 (+) Transcript_63837:31-690(+)